MTAGPLTLEDLERLIRWGERCDVVEALKATHEALRSVMADRDMWKGQATAMGKAALEARDLARAEKATLALANRALDEAREQVRLLTEQLAEAKLAGDLEHEGRMAAQESVRSLTVERDAARRDSRESLDLCEEAQTEANRLRARLEDYSSFGKQAVDRAELAEIDRDALRARLSRAREALDAYDEDPPVFWGQSAEDPALVAWVERQEKALAALRAALSEPPAG